jgi:hypothetical protein
MHGRKYTRNSLRDFWSLESEYTYEHLCLSRDSMHATNIRSRTVRLWKLVASRSHIIWKKIQKDFFLIFLFVHSNSHKKYRSKSGGKIPLLRLTDGILTLILLTWRIWWVPNNAGRWQMGFKLAFKGLSVLIERYSQMRRLFGEGYSWKGREQTVEDTDMMTPKYSETLFPSQITKGLAWDRTDTTVMTEWRLTTWIMAQTT